MDQHRDRPLRAAAQALGHLVAGSLDRREGGRFGARPGVIATGRYVQGQVSHQVSFAIRTAVRPASGNRL